MYQVPEQLLGLMQDVNDAKRNRGAFGGGFR